MSQAPPAKGPSRSARRKARKRQLKRLGLLPGPRGVGVAKGSRKSEPSARPIPSEEVEAESAREAPQESLVPVTSAEELHVGDICCYQFLEVWNGSPELSEVRRGQVTAWDSKDRVVTLRPHPDGSAHPLRERMEAARAAEDEGWDAPDEQGVWLRALQICGRGDAVLIVMLRLPCGVVVHGMRGEGALIIHFAKAIYSR